MSQMTHRCDSLSQANLSTVCPQHDGYSSVFTHPCLENVSGFRVGGLKTALHVAQPKLRDSHTALTKNSHHGFPVCRVTVHSTYLILTGESTSSSAEITHAAPSTDSVSLNSQNSYLYFFIIYDYPIYFHVYHCGKVEGE